jgi:hypothetical protein
MPTPSGTRFRVKTTSSGKKVRLAFAPGSNKVIEAKKLTSRRSQTGRRR